MKRRNEMAKFYFTYGSDPAYPFYGGWTEIEADNQRQAIGIFKAIHPDREDSESLNCADYYDELRFGFTEMRQCGNRGAFCHEQIKLGRLDAIDLKGKAEIESKQKYDLDVELAQMKAKLVGGLIDYITVMDRLIAGR